MAGRDPWTMRNGGILGGVFPDDAQDLAYRDLYPYGDSSWSQATRDLTAQSAGASATRGYPVPGQPAPWFPSAPIASISPSQAQRPSWLVDSAGNPPPLLHELPYFTSTPTLPQAWATPMPNRMTPEASSSIPSSEGAVPVGLRSPTIPWPVPMPWPTPAPAPSPPTIPGFEEWLKNANKGLEGLFNYFRSRSRSSSGGDDESECDRRHQEEIRECDERRPFMAHPDYYDGCRDRAQERWLGCMKNGGRPPRREVPKWGDEDEETWIDPNR